MSNNKTMASVMQIAKMLLPILAPVAKRAGTRIVKRIANRRSRRRPARKTRQPGKRRAPVQISAPLRPAPAPPVTMNATETINTLQVGVTISTDGTPKSLNCNITDPSVFPRLSQLSMQYQRCDWRSVILNYTPSCPTSTAGQIAMAFLSDPQSEIPTDFYSVQALKGAVAGSVWDTLNLGVEKRDMNPAISSNPIQEDSTGEPDRFTSAGIFVIACLGAPANTTIGTLRISYNVLLSEPREVQAATAVNSHLTFGAHVATHELDLAEASDIEGILGVVPGETGQWVKRSRAPLMLIYEGHSAASNNGPVLTFHPLDGTSSVLAPHCDGRLLVDQTRNTLVYEIPAGPGYFTVATGAQALLTAHIFLLTMRTAFDFTLSL